MHAIQDRFGDSQAKRAGDAWDLHELLTLHNQTGAIADALRDAPGVLAAAELQTALKAGDSAKSVATSSDVAILPGEAAPL